jgi:hypothetical protein
VAERSRSGRRQPSGRSTLAGSWRALRRFLTPGWLLIHLLLWGAAVGMAFLGRWQLHVSEADGYPFQNTSYIVQWWLFSACALLFWFRLVRDSVRQHPAPRSTSGELVLRGGRGQLERPGPAMLQTQTAGGETVAYRGYHLPDSSKTLVPSHGDAYHDSYNDYLWQLAMADGAAPTQLLAALQDDRPDPAEPSAAEAPRVISPSDPGELE